MFREILFRGIPIDGDQFVYGFLTYNKESGKSWIGSFAFNNYYFVEVKTETVSQYTGLDDKNGVKIFDGDKIKIIIPTDVFWGKNSGMEKEGIVRYEPEYGGYIIEWEWSKNQHHEQLTCDIACRGEVFNN